jgi:hypothetical protein
MRFRAFDKERDQEATRRIWREIGWLSAGQEEVMDTYVGACQGHVAEVDGQAECLVLTAPGTARYLDATLPLCGVTGVTTSRVVRRQGCATRLTARAIAERATAGDVVAGLGMFEQGFYNRLGMGTGGYEHQVSFDPSRLAVQGRPRIPLRFTPEDWKQLHQARMERRLGHGAVTMTPAALTRAETLEDGRKGFGLGYRDGPEAAISHYVWLSAEDVSHGPYHVRWMAYQTGDQFMELMQVIKALGDQVMRVTMQEPGHVMMQDLIEQPFKQSRMTRHTNWEAGVRGSAWWQARILDLAACLAATTVAEGALRFNLSLGDPIVAYLPEDAPWRGVAGEYVVTLGQESSARRGHEPDLPTLEATVNAFTRLWLGVRPASGLAITDGLRGPAELLAALDRTLRLPEPHIDWPL